MIIRKYWKNISILLLFIWAIAVSILYWQMSRTPRVLATQLGKSLVDVNTPVSDLEETQFLKNFMESYLSFDSKDYWQEQVQLTYLMNNQLATARIEELKTINVKAKSSYLVQTAHIVSITESAANTFEVQTLIHTEFGTERHTNLNKTHITLQKVTRTLDNPYGLQIEKIEQFPLEKNYSLKVDSIYLQDGKSTSLVFHCPILKVEGDDNKILNIKVINSKLSEVQLSLNSEKPLIGTLLFKCDNKQFSLKASTDTTKSTRWQEVLMEQALPITQTKKVDKRYDKDIEKILNMEITN